MTFRAWEQKDNALISEIEKQCFKTPWSLEMLDSSLKLNNFFGVVCCEIIDGVETVVGYIGSIFDNWDAEILNVAVTAQFRRQKIGERLLQSVIDEMRKREKERLFLEVRKSNEAAKGLYAKMGFTEIGIRKNYYENTEDAIVMAKMLKG